MNSKRAIQEFELQRRIFNHDMLHNEFIRLIGPAWCEGRMGPYDSVFQALLGEPNAREQVAEAMEAWKKICSPAFVRLSDNVGSIFGFVVTDAWIRESQNWREARLYFDEFHLPRLALSQDDAKVEAKLFWKHCDTIRFAVTAWRERFSEFIARWDPDLLEGGRTS